MPKSKEWQVCGGPGAYYIDGITYDIEELSHAQLIAAAPKLEVENRKLKAVLDAAKDIVDDLKLFVSKQGPGPDRRLARLLTAITKAEGSR